MKIVVPVKRAINYNVKPQVRADGTGGDLAYVKISMKPFAEVAVEETVRLKEKKGRNPDCDRLDRRQKAREMLRTSLAMGADRSILIVCESEVEPLARDRAARALYTSSASLRTPTWPNVGT